ncbi:hypothetical protein ACQR16_02025 [Bradyrhizobium oligotrophicum]|uniref:hypothetical protein n=1 Tax=Bradyrhizobium oligotrophicum TaxID=44255 RepID=UPI003EC0C924
MTQPVRLIMAAAATALAMVSASEPVLARGAAASIMNSPGYQRRLQESRQQLGAPPAPFVAEQRYYRPKAKRHRHHHAH